MADRNNGAAEAVDTSSPEAPPEQKSQISDLLSGFPRPSEESDPAETDEVLEEDLELEEELEDDDEEEIEEEEPSSTKVLLDEIQGLKSQIEALKRGEGDEEEGTPPPEPLLSTEPIAFFTEEDFAEAMQSSEKMNEVLNRGLASLTERLLATIPQIVDSKVTRDTTLKDTVTKFYNDHEDLLPHRQYVGFLTNKLISQNPGKELPEILKQVATQARKDLNLSKRAADRENQRRSGGKGNFAPSGKGGGRRQAVEPELDEQQKQIVDIIS